MTYNTCLHIHATDFAGKPIVNEHFPSRAYRLHISMLRLLHNRQQQHPNLWNWSILKCPIHNTEPHAH